MTLWRSLLWATLAASIMALGLVGWLLIPPTWMIPVASGFLVVFIFVDVFVWCFWFTRT